MKQSKIKIAMSIPFCIACRILVKVRWSEYLAFEELGTIGESAAKIIVKKPNANIMPTRDIYSEIANYLVLI